MTTSSHDKLANLRELLKQDHIPLSLTADQQNAVAEINLFLCPTNKRRSFVATGSAGTGKTTLIRLLKDMMPSRVVIAAPTNKAVNVLRSKGFKKATTIDRVIHQTSYVPFTRAPTDDEIKQYVANDMEIPDSVTEECFEKSERKDGGPIVVVDEASMTSQYDMERLTALYDKVIFVGDGFQLPPVEGTKWFQTIDPDVMLHEIVRTAAQSEITQIANLIRHRNPEWRTHQWQSEVTIVNRHDIRTMLDAMQHADIVLAHKNATCDDQNIVIRDLRGLTDPVDPYRPTKGDKLLAWETASSFAKSEIYDVEYSARIENGYLVTAPKISSPIKVAKAMLKQQATKLIIQGFDRFSFAHCMTTHKSQGSEWDNVVVLAHDHSVRFDDHWNWLYTACTRAKKHLTIVT